jgi:hypothetical protein
MRDCGIDFRNHILVWHMETFPTLSRQTKMLQYHDSLVYNSWLPYSKIGIRLEAEPTWRLATNLLSVSP